MNKFLPLVAVASFLAVACTSADEGPTAVSGPANRQPPPAVEDYLSTVLSGYASMQDLARKVVPEQYSLLVERFREGGLEALTEQERNDLLLMAQLAFLSLAQTLRYVVTSEDAPDGDDEDRNGEAVVEEVYAPFTSRQDNLPEEWEVLVLLARRAKANGIGWFWGLTPYSQPGGQGEVLLFVEFDPDNELEDGIPAAIITEWANVGGLWVCYRTSPDSSYRYYGSLLDHWWNFTALAEGALVGFANVDGEERYVLEERGVRYLLDAERLWLRQYEYVDTDGAMITVKLEAVNEDIRIEAPDVDVECVEEATE